MRKPPVLKTPLNEEKNLKRSRDETTPSTMPIDQTFVKRQRLNPYAEEEYSEETSGNSTADNRPTIPIGDTPYVSQIQALERQ